ncbi:MAG: hypothetical protein F9K47_09790 [Burkholderiales bacterium]|nr:MAG: hypothetical protein F9K47_09790 [Burkholderiales bacterium]
MASGREGRHRDRLWLALSPAVPEEAALLNAWAAWPKERRQERLRAIVLAGFQALHGDVAAPVASMVSAPRRSAPNKPAESAVPVAPASLARDDFGNLGALASPLKFNDS